MKILIKVTKDILRRSSKCNASILTSCALALAVREIFPKAKVNHNIGISQVYKILS